MQESLKKLIEKAVTELYSTRAAFSVDHPKDMSHGDFATNVALLLSKDLGKNPMDIAKEICEQIEKIQDAAIASVSVAAPGFINFTLARDVFVQGLSTAIQAGAEWGKNDRYKGKKILVEHSSPNLFKPFHIGHLMNNTVGESLVRLAKASGADVATMSFPSDISLGVAKAIFILLETKGADFIPTDVSVLGDAYVAGTKRFDEDPSTHARIKEITDNLYTGVDSPELTLFKKCKAFNIAYFEDIVAKLGSHFDSYIYESEAGVEGKALVQKYTPGIFTESEGAIVYIPEEESKLHTAVFINSQGNPTYEAKDLGLLELKFTRTKPDISLFVTDNQQVSHFQVVLDASKNIDPTWNQRSFHRYHGRMSFKGAKMSSRLGGVPLAEDIIATLIEEVKEKNPDSTDESALRIGLAALKTTILRTMAGRDINFDPETSLSFEGDSGPYLQYAAVRAGAVIAKASVQGLTPKLAENPPEDTALLERLIARFPGVAARAIDEWAPHYIVTYLLELAQAFNSWYGQCKIIDEDIAVSEHRLLIAEVVQITLTNGLAMLAIEVPEKM